MKQFLNQLSLLIGTVALSLGVLFLFFGGTWEGVRVGLEIFGVIFVLQTSYNVLKKDKEEKEESEKVKKISDKYFK